MIHRFFFFFAKKLVCIYTLFLLNLKLQVCLHPFFKTFIKADLFTSEYSHLLILFKSLLLESPEIFFLIKSL